jgi:hypothetical protein
MTSDNLNHLNGIPRDEDFGDDGYGDGDLNDPDNGPLND